MTNISRTTSDTSNAGKRVAVGDRAPDFTLPDQTGKPVRLGDLLGERVVVLYFYPKDETPGCTAEACSFRDSYQVFKDAGAEVVGISTDTVESHQSFAAHHQLPFVLLSDADGALRKRYGVPTTFGLLPGRVTYVIDRDGIVRHIFSSQLQAEKHVSEAIKTIKAIQTPAE
ncbi:MAG TPA: peroxiredoxin [Ktedonobacterales bacterium]